MYKDELDLSLPLQMINFSDELMVECENLTTYIDAKNKQKVLEFIEKHNYIWIRFVLDKNNIRNRIIREMLF